MGKRGPKPRTVQEIMNAHVLPEPNSGCWLWDGPTNGNGYGILTRGSSSKGTSTRVRAHRFVWQALRGDVPQGLVLCHRCDTPACVNPDHLFTGTQADRDAAQKGRLHNRFQQEKTHCARGHAFDDKNTIKILSSAGQRRMCRKCQTINMRVWRKKRRASTAKGTFA